MDGRCCWPPWCPDGLGPEPSFPHLPTLYQRSQVSGSCSRDQPQGKPHPFSRPRAPGVPAPKPQPARGCLWGRPEGLERWQTPGPPLGLEVHNLQGRVWDASDPHWWTYMNLFWLTICRICNYGRLEIR